MSFRTEADAARAYRDAISRVLHCVSTRVFVASGKPDASGQRAIVVHRARPLRLVSSIPLALRVAMEYRTVATTDRVRIHITAYTYALEDALTTQELFAYHWHPGLHNAVGFPHLHIGPASGRLRDVYARAHMDTGHLALPTMLRLIVRDFAVEPTRTDWSPVLTEAHAFWDRTVSYQSR